MPSVLETANTLMEETKKEGSIGLYNNPFLWGQNVPYILKKIAMSPYCSTSRSDM